MAKIFDQLRKVTQELHERLESKNLANRILDHSIDLATYQTLLLQNYRAYSLTEPQIKRFLPFAGSGKADRLRVDLEKLEVPVTPFQAPYKINSKAEAFGAAYVVEGSVLGGMLIASHLSKCRHLQAVEKHHFFNGDKSSLHTWRKLKQELSQAELSASEKEQLFQKAKETFSFFERVFDEPFHSQGWKKSVEEYKLR